MIFFFFLNVLVFKITRLKPLLNLIMAVNEHQACIVFSPEATAIGFYSGGEIAASSASALLVIFSGASGWDAKYLLSIFSSLQLWGAAAELEAVVPDVTAHVESLFVAWLPLVKAEILLWL